MAEERSLFLLKSPDTESEDYKFYLLESGYKVTMFRVSEETVFCRKSSMPMAQMLFTGKAATIARETFLRNVAAEPDVYVEGTGSVYYWRFLAVDGSIYVIGPMSTVSIREAVLWDFFFRRSQKMQENLIPVLTMDDSAHAAETACYLFTGQRRTLLPQALHSEVLPIEFQDLENLIMDYRKNTQLNERARTSYAQEQKLFQAIENGTLDQLEVSTENGFSLSEIGIMVENNAFKQIEYAVVVSIALGARAAMRGGIPSGLAYDISDIYLQKCAKCRTVNELMHLNQQCLTVYSDAVRKKAKEKERDYHVERCKNFIARHIFKDFTVAEMAEKLEMNPSYMTAHFKKNTGITVTQYIMQQRLRAAANQLKYSDAAIGEIAEYLCFSSPSRMSGYFKKEYGLTPFEYRKRHKDDSAY